jgi:hypothetical protein
LRYAPGCEKQHHSCDDNQVLCNGLAINVHVEASLLTFRILLVEIEAYAAQDGEITRHVLYIGDNRAVWGIVAIAYCRSVVELG